MSHLAASSDDDRSGFGMCGFLELLYVPDHQRTTRRVFKDSS